jgi:hypothetical protein
LSVDELLQMLDDLLHRPNFVIGLGHRHAVALDQARVNALSHFELAIGASEHFVNVAHAI